MVPCGHVLHLECAEYLRRGVKLACSESDSELTATFRCPSCSEPALRTLRLFLPSHDASQSGADEKTTEHVGAKSSTLARVFHLQRKELMYRSDITKTKQHLERLTRRCAAQHALKATLSAQLLALGGRERQLVVDNVDDDAALRGMNEGALIDYIQSTQKAIADARKNVAEVDSRLLLLRKEHVALQNDDGCDAGESDEESESLPMRGLRAPPASPAIGPRAKSHRVDPAAKPVASKAVEVVDVDATSISSLDDDCLVVGTSHRAKFASDENLVPLQMTMRRVTAPVMGRSVGRSLRDLPRREDALWQPDLTLERGAGPPRY